MSQIAGVNFLFVYFPFVIAETLSGDTLMVQARLTALRGPMKGAVPQRW